MLNEPQKISVSIALRELETRLVRLRALLDQIDVSQRLTPDALNRLRALLDPLQWQWRGVDARKDHICVRGCAIKDGDEYFQKRHGYGGWGSDLKFCAACTAMILYCRDVDKLPPAYFTHWDTE